MTLNQEQSDRITDLILAKSELEAEVSRLRTVLEKIAIPEGRFFLSEYDAQAEGIEQYWAYERGCGHALAMVKERAQEAIKSDGEGVEGSDHDEAGLGWRGPTGRR